MLSPLSVGAHNLHGWLDDRYSQYGRGEVTKTIAPTAVFALRCGARLASAGRRAGFSSAIEE
jgi:hypothetical protein